MKCPFCHQIQTSVVESRLGDDYHSVRRRRECDACHKRFTTFERAEGPLVRVVKKDGSRELFSRDKLAGGVRAAFHKRPISFDKVEKVVDEIEKWVLSQESIEVPSHVIGMQVLNHIKLIDKVAWLRFASVYLAFDNLKDFEKLLDTELKKKK